MSSLLIHVAVYDQLADWEIGYLTAHVGGSLQWQREPGRYAIVTVAETAAPVRTIGGLTLTPDAVLADLDPADSAMLVLPGSTGWVAGAHPGFEAAARRWVAAGTPLAAICGATFGLARAGLLDDRAHTSGAPEFLAMSDYAGGGHYVHERAVTDRGVTTAGPQSALEFAREVFRVLDLYTPETLDAWYGLYATGDPEHYFTLQAAS